MDAYFKLLEIAILSVLQVYLKSELYDCMEHLKRENVSIELEK